MALFLHDVQSVASGPLQVWQEGWHALQVRFPALHVPEMNDPLGQVMLQASQTVFMVSMHAWATRSCDSHWEHGLHTRSEDGVGLFVSYVTPPRHLVVGLHPRSDALS